ncbi:MAG: glycosyltransferase family 4 protein [Actinomycetaceae bacterium]|nr:glycosyltransferase family 4 protein [Actinomycetaceae bacterium]
MRRTLLVTNDFPPRLGGIQTFLENYVRRLPAADIVVYASTENTGDPDGATSEYDKTTPWKTYRYPGAMMLPSPRVRREMVRIICQERIHTVWFGAAAPLGLLAPAARAAGAKRVIVTTHGHEIGWTMFPGARFLVKKIFRAADVVTYISDYTLRRLRKTIGTTPVAHLPGGIDTDVFRPNEDARQRLRHRYSLGSGPVVLCLSRLVPRKGQDLLIKAWPAVTKVVPEAKLVIGGRGRYEKTLKKLAAVSSAHKNIVFTGAISPAELADHYALADIFAMPCRTRGGGLDVEGLGIVYLEAGACEIPSIAGNSGGAPETIREGETGFVVDGRDATVLVERICQLISRPLLRTRMGNNARDFVAKNWHWDLLAKHLIRLCNNEN